MVISTRDAWKSAEVRFLAVGIFNTAFGYLAFVFLYLAFGTRVHYLIVSSIAHVVSVFVAFTGHRILVFRSTRPWLEEFIRYNVSLLFSFIIGLLTLYAMVEFARLSPSGGQAVAVIVSVVVSYVAHRYYSFRR